MFSDNIGFDFGLLLRIMYDYNGGGKKVRNWWRRIRTTATLVSKRLTLSFHYYRYLIGEL